MGRVCVTLILLKGVARGAASYLRLLACAEQNANTVILTIRKVAIDTVSAFLFTLLYSTLTLPRTRLRKPLPWVRTSQTSIFGTKSSKTQLIQTLCINLRGYFSWFLTLHAYSTTS